MAPADGPGANSRGQGLPEDGLQSEETHATPEHPDVTASDDHRATPEAPSDLFAALGDAGMIGDVPKTSRPRWSF